jgi:hypothetical protein
MFLTMLGGSLVIGAGLPHVRPLRWSEVQGLALLSPAPEPRVCDHPA